MNKNITKKVGLSSLALATAFSFGLNSVEASGESTSEIIPNKIEFVQLQDGSNARMLDFDSEEEAQKYKEQQGITLDQETLYQENNSLKTTSPTSRSSIQPLAIGTSYSMVKYNGTKKYKMDVQYSYNGTSSAQPWKTTVERSESSSTSISVGTSFKSVFQAEVGKEYNKTTKWTQSFNLKIPAKKQLEVWSWNIADSWIFSSKPFLGQSKQFIVYRPTTTYGHEIYTYPKRDPR